MMRLTRIPRPSPNHGARPAGAVVNAIVLHCDASPRIEQTLDYLALRSSQVSYHMVIGRTGTVFDVVPSARRAWHAGVSSFAGVGDCNDYSVGVCFANQNDGHEPYPIPQLLAGAELCALLIEAYPALTVDRITTHRAVARPAGRKIDPTPPFDLDAFHGMVRDALLAHHLARGVRP